MTNSMTMQHSENSMQNMGKFTLMAGIALLSLGFLSIIRPTWSGLAVTTLIGVLLGVAGVARLVFAFHTRTLGRGLWQGLIGLVTVGCSLYLITQPRLGLLSLTFFLSSLLIAEGVFEALAAFRMRDLPGWGWLLFSAVASLLLGVFIMAQWPVSGLWAVGTLVGIKLLTLGASLTGIGYAFRQHRLPTGVNAAGLTGGTVTRQPLSSSTHQSL